MPTMTLDRPARRSTSRPLSAAARPEPADDRVYAAPPVLVPARRRDERLTRVFRTIGGGLVADFGRD